MRVIKMVNFVVHPKEEIITYDVVDLENEIVYGCLTSLFEGKDCISEDLNHMLNTAALICGDENMLKIRFLWESIIEDKKADRLDQIEYSKVAVATKVLLNRAFSRLILVMNRKGESIAIDMLDLPEETVSDIYKSFIKSFIVFTQTRKTPTEPRFSMLKRSTLKKKKETKAP